jgi:eukaryotic-like serine/threonine-protein kinase
LSSGERKVLVPSGGDARYLSTGHLVYVVGSTLMAVPFDIRKLQTAGEPVPVVEGIAIEANDLLVAGEYALSNTGTLVYVPRATFLESLPRTLQLVDRMGTVKATGITIHSAGYARISPDGKYVALETTDGHDTFIAIYEIAGTSAMRRLTFGGPSHYPIWSADGERIAFQSIRDGAAGIFWQRADGAGTAERLTKAEAGIVHIPDSFSTDGQHLSFTATNGRFGSVWILSLGDNKVTQFASAPSALVGRSAFSPDARWIAYQSSETGNDQIFVQPFPATGAKYQISSGGSGGIHPVWSHDGRELLFHPPVARGGVVAVRIAPQPNFSFANAVRVADPGTEGGSTTVRNYDITPDGKQFIGARPADINADAVDPSQVQVVFNWFDELRQRVPVK